MRIAVVVAALLLAGGAQAQQQLPQNLPSMEWIMAERARVDKEIERLEGMLAKAEAQEREKAERNASDQAGGWPPHLYRTR